MTNLLPLNLRELEQQKWQQAKWSTIEPKDVVAVALEDGEVAVGTVDEFTVDRSVFWLRLSGSNERRCFLTSEMYGAWLPAPARQAADLDIPGTGVR